MALPAGIVAAIEAGETLVAPSPQRAAALREAWARRQLAAGRRVWTTPDILSFAAFAERCLLEQAEPGLPRRRPLSRVEQQLLWQQVAASSPAGSNLLSGAVRLAEALRRADGLLRSYAIPATSLSAYPSPEARCLQDARRRIDARLERLRARLDWSDETVAPGPRSQAVRLAGFSEFTPAQRRFLDGHGVARSARCVASGAAQTAALRVYAAQHPAEELQQIARWCRERLEADASARLLIIVPDLDSRRTLLQRALLAELDPRSLAAGSSSSATFAFEGGAPLLSEPCIATDLVRLEALVTRRERERWLAWLRSAEAGMERGVWHRELERRLLSWQGEPLDFTSLLALAKLDSTSLPEPLARMRRAADLLDERSAAPAQHWARAFDRALAILQGEPLPLDSAAWQIRERWCRMLEEYAAASSLVGSLSARDALAQLRALAQYTRFAPASPDVAVLVTAATGDPIVEYDGIWVAGLHEAAFPYPAQFDGFVPAALQRAFGVAQADPRALLARAEREFAAWRGRTRELVVSWASEHDGAPQSPSPLLRPWLGEVQRFAVRASRAAADWLRRQAPAPVIETWSDPLGLPVPAGTLLEGGTALLDSANRCAFRGYAQWRLDARGAEEPETGIAAWLRGRLLHGALELLWQQWRDQATLRSVDPQRRRAAVAAALARAAQRHAQARQTPLVRRALERELARAEVLILEVIDRELERAPFAILALEHAVVLPLDGFSLQCRIDRIDRLVDGSLAIIDYKTGRAVPTDWHGARPDTVQMMAYRVALEHEALSAPSDKVPEKVAALGYLQLSEGSVRYHGVARDPATFGPPQQRRPRRDPGWEQRGAEWNAHLQWLARRVRRAEATVEPRPAICRDCDLSLLCRRAELEAALDLDDELPPTAVEDAQELAVDEA